MSRALPHQRVPIAEAGGTASNPFYAFLQDVERALQDGTLDVSGLQTQIDAIKAQLAEDDPTIGLLLGQQSIRVIGQLKDGNSFVMLEGDSDAPGPTYAYGTDAAGVKGWHPISAAMLQGTGVVLTVGADGVTTFDLAELADSGAGAFKLITRDSYGRVSGTADGTTSDVPEGANLYHTAARVRAAVLTGLSTATNAAITAADTVLGALGKLQAQITGLASTVSDLITQTITNGDTTHAPSGDAVFDALAGKFDKSGGTVNGNVTVTGNQDFGSAAGGTQTNFHRPGSSPAGSAIQFTSPAAVPGIAVFTGLTSRSDFRFPYNEVLIGASLSSTAPDSFFRIVRSACGPHADGTMTAAEPSRRYSTVYAITGAINTSDAREKDNIRELTPVEIACAVELAAAGRIYQWKSALAEKGDAARLHCGPTVQGVIAIMESHGLDPFRYGFVCYDEWEEQPEIRDEETGEVTQEHRPAGNRYSLRPSELESFIAAGMAAKVASLEARLAALVL